MGVIKQFVCAGCEKKVDGGEIDSTETFPKDWFWLNRISINIGTLETQDDKKFHVQNEVFCGTDCLVRWLEKGIKTLIKQLKDRNERVREDAVWALCERADSRALEPLMEVLKDKTEYSWARVGAATAIGGIGDPAGISLLIETFTDEDEYSGVRESVARVLGQHGGHEAVTFLIH